MNAVLQTPRLLIRTWEMADVDAAFAMYGDPQVTRWLWGDPLPNLETMRQRMVEIIERNATFSPGLGSFPAVSRETGRIVGTALIKPMPGADGKLTDDIEVGWHVTRQHWGRGFATEFGLELLRHGFDTLQIPRLHAVVDPPNVASQRVAQKIGMRHTGQTVRYYDGKPIEHFELDRDEWSQRQAGGSNAARD